MTHRSRRRMRLVALPLALTGGLLAASSAMAVKGNVVVVGEDQAPEGLNQVSLGGASVVTHRVLCPIQCENLLTMGPDYQYRPVLAAGIPTVQTKPDFSVTFKIRPDAKWSDGRPVTSNDVRFTWRVMMNPKFKAASRTGWDQIKTIQTPNPTTAKITFKQPYASWRDVYSPSGGGILLPAHALKGADTGTSFNTVWNNPKPGTVMGTGPFVLKEFRKDERMVVVPNKNYWNKKAMPKIEQIVSIFLKETTSQDVQFQSGEVNLIDTPAFALVPTLEKIPNTKVAKPAGVLWEHLAFNTERGPTADINVRRAISHAINPAELINVSAKGQVYPLRSFLVPQQRPYANTAWARYTPDAAKVDQYMKAAGYAKNSSGFYAKGGTELNLVFKTIAGNSTRETNFTLMKAQLEKVGIKMTPTFDENFFDENGSLNTGNFDVAEFAWSGSPDPGSTQLFNSKFVPTTENPSGQNVYRYRDPNLDTLLASSDRTISVSKRAEIFGKIQNLMADRAVLLPLYQRPEVVAYARNLNGLVVNPHQVGITDQGQNWFYTGGKAVR